ncbi:hypothetical protein mRhiFer1_010075 [Rhinolophus ferrumequinum]|uniref:Uncharacterized protein n=1 Tax=Rhinolophus ferrumequinum TaxID=59479 RepID=A0A7J7Y5R3_RHIFE|nr:hypothetical protein mRhiFer1_010075 [Rhinolophus ferrumequinum]
MEEGGAPGWRGKREGGGRGSRRREAGRADAAGEGAGQEGEGERERRKAEAAAAAAVAAAATAAAAALQVAPRSGFRRRAGERASSSGQTPGRTTPATRAPRRHRVHPRAAQAPRAEEGGGFWISKWVSSTRGTPESWLGVAKECEIPMTTCLQKHL